MFVCMCVFSQVKRMFNFITIIIENSLPFARVIAPFCHANRTRFNSKSTTSGINTNEMLSTLHGMVET